MESQSLNSKESNFGEKVLQASKFVEDGNEEYKDFDISKAFNQELTNITNYQDGSDQERLHYFNSSPY